jgi:adenylate cyclase
LKPQIGDALRKKDPESLLPTKEEITRQLERMVDSPDFHASPQQVDLLKYVVDQTLAGNTDRIKGYTVATEVFGRRSDFDQSIDPIVSIQASRLRQALERYYETAGKYDPIRIDIPRGTYVPVFEKRPHTQTIDASIDREHPDIKAKSTWPSVFIQSLSNLSGDPELEFWGIGLATELADELSRYPDIRVMILGPGNPNTTADKHNARFVIGGSVRSDGKVIKIILNLMDTRTGGQIWSDSHRSAIEAARLITFQEDVARTVAVKIAGQYGWIAKTMDRSAKSYSIEHSEVYEAVLRYYEYMLTFTPETFSRAMAALQKAVAIDPECGPPWCMLAQLFANIYVFDIPGFKDPLEKAYEFAQKGTRLAPQDQRCRIMKGYIHLFRNELAEGLAEAERALKLGPQTLFMMDGIGYVMTMMGDWERGPALIEEVIRLNPFYSNLVHYALWINWLRQENFAKAYDETLKLNRPAFFWDHIARVSSLGLIGNIEDGRKAATELLKLKPDFAERGRILIGHYIKFGDIFERIIEGLNAVGVEVK